MKVRYCRGKEDVLGISRKIRMPLGFKDRQQEHMLISPFRKEKKKSGLIIERILVQSK